MAVMAVDADPPAAVKQRLEAFAGEVLAAAMNRPVQVVNGGLYLRGLLEQGARRSLEPIVERLGGDADYQSMQQLWLTVVGSGAGGQAGGGAGRAGG
jgi:hypothetical protein